MSPRSSFTVERSHRADLTDLHALCDANYRRVLQLFPDYEHRNRHDFSAGSAEVVFAVTDRGRYTTTLQVTLTGTLPAPLGVSCFDLRVYHDARMAEVIAFQSRRTGGPRYRYPNPDMHQRNEKLGQNQFVADLLAFCLAEGRASDALLPEWPRG